MLGWAFLPFKLLQLQTARRGGVVLDERQNSELVFIRKSPIRSTKCRVPHPSGFPGFLLQRFTQSVLINLCDMLINTLFSVFIYL